MLKKINIDNNLKTESILETPSEYLFLTTMDK
jgi:hypothetical protein